MGSTLQYLGRHSRRCSLFHWPPNTNQLSITMAKKKGFMTPERKKKLRTLLRKKAAEELKKEQERKAEERLRVIAERCGNKAEFVGLHGRPEEDLPGVFRQVVRTRGRDVLPAARGNPARPADQRADHLCV